MFYVPVTAGSIGPLRSVQNWMFEWLCLYADAVLPLLPQAKEGKKNTKSLSALMLPASFFMAPTVDSITPLRRLAVALSTLLEHPKHTSIYGWSLINNGENVIIGK